jgi:hypothetical protein
MEHSYISPLQCYIGIYGDISLTAQLSCAPAAAVAAKLPRTFQGTCIETRRWPEHSHPVFLPFVPEALVGGAISEGEHAHSVLLASLRQTIDKRPHIRLSQVVKVQKTKFRRKAAAPA